MGTKPKEINIREFKKDWNEGMPIKEMARKHGFYFTYVGDVAKRLNLKPRRKTDPHALAGGEWVYDNKGIARWVSNISA